MGIKGIYKEIGAGTRIAFTRLAVDSLESRGRPLRLAIDISIWQFQVQAARGGANPAIRTLFYRLVRLLGMPVHPVFVFDGLNKPQFKRNKRSGTGDGMATAMAKRLIRLFGFAVHDAPGEAEAECALLQQRGVVDAVLSEDVDTLMFGCTRTLRNWSGPQPQQTTTTAAASSGSSGGGGSGKPTHVSLYESARLGQSASGLDREGMVLVALMSGGDYLPEGVPGCGVKLACEAAKAGFGRSLCRLKRADAPTALAQWRTHLQHELRTNESRFFRTCHHKLAIPESFPNLEVLRYYTHPVVSPPEVVERVRDMLASADYGSRSERSRALRAAAAAAAAGRGTRPVDVPGLRDFVAETFDWTNRVGAVKFIRVLAPSLLARILLLRWSGDYEPTDEEEDGDDLLRTRPVLVQGISKQRAHSSTDETPEMRVSFVPVAVVGLDLDAEQDVPLAVYGRDGLALNSDDEFDEPAPSAAAAAADEEDGAITTATTTTAAAAAAAAQQAVVPSSGTVAAAAAAAAAARKSAPFDPTQPDVAWIARTIVQIGAPQALAAFEQRQQQKRAKSAGAAGKGRAKKSGSSSNGMKPGALDRYVKVTKSAASRQQPAGEKAVNTQVQVGAAATGEEEEEADHSWEALLRQVQGNAPSQPQKTRTKKTTTATAAPAPTTARRRAAAAADPWALSGSQSARVTKAGAASEKKKTALPAVGQSPTTIEVIDLLSSPPAQSALPSSPSPDLLPQQPQQPPSTPTKAATTTTTTATRSSRLAGSPAKRSTTAAGGGRAGRPRGGQAAAPLAASIGPTTPGSSPRQTSIRTFFTKPATQAVAPAHAGHTSHTVILVSDDDDDDDDDDSPFVSRRHHARCPGGEDNEEDEAYPLVSSSPPVFSPAAKTTTTTTTPTRPRRLSSFGSSGVSKSPIQSRKTRPNKTDTPEKTDKTNKTSKTKKTKKTLYVPRASAVGYFREEVVDAEEDAEEGHLQRDADDQTNSGRRQRRRGWRQSEVGMVDLTGLDQA